MRGFVKNIDSFAVVFIITGIFAALVESSPLAESGGALLFNLVFWVSLIQGCIAVAASCDLIGARWVMSVREDLLSVYPLLLFTSVLFLLLTPFVDSYPWAGRGGVWFSKGSFILRNVLLLFASYVAARTYATSASRNDEKKYFYAALYLVVFAVSQSLIAFDWVMSLAHPWYSTLFGAYFFIEALYAGFALSGLLYIFLYRMEPGGDSATGSRNLKDLGTLLFGFSLLWAGLFYAQFLVIWYGNLPEEVGFLAARVTESPLRELSIAILAHYFFIPFLVLLSGRAKTSPFVISAVSLTILSGLLLERFIFLVPEVTLSPGALVIHFFLLFSLFVLLLVKKSPGARLGSPD